MAWVFFFVSLTIPLLHIQFVKGLLKKRGQEFGWNRDTLAVMYMGSVSSIAISTFLLIAESIGIDVKIGPNGYLFAIFSSLLIYETYIQKRND
jgi:hypothetical protein